MEWISVKDRLPKDQEEVLVCTRSKNGVRNIDKGYLAIDRFIHRGCAEVTHWMPLPRFPEERESDAPKLVPLTLDELRQMKDEPVYLKIFDKDKSKKTGWYILKLVTDDKIIFRGWEFACTTVDGLGVDYNLYRQKPEEG